MYKRIHPQLPIFNVPLPETNLIYVPPGRFTIISRLEAHELETIWLAADKPPSGNYQLLQKKTWLEKVAAEAQAQWLKLQNTPFAPECLTVYLSNYCNCQCVYCYASNSSSRLPTAGNGSLPVASIQAVAAALGLVSASCRQRGQALYLVVHGGGEPTLHWRLLKRIYRLAHQTAERQGIGLRSYIATNGILSKKRAVWLAQHFGRIGLSCDGPPEIQNRQRRTVRGEATSHKVEQTAHIIKESGGTLDIRATITKDSLEKQAQIVEYICTTLNADNIRLELAYRDTSPAGTFGMADADTFVTHFLEAQKVAAHYGRWLEFPSLRIDELHGPFCNIGRNTLHLCPDGFATDCFVHFNGNSEQERKFIIGQYDPISDSIALNEKKITATQKAVFALPDFCQSCINIYHCNRGCPDTCLQDGHFSKNQSGSEIQAFRCRVNKCLSVAWVKNAGIHAKPVKTSPKNHKDTIKTLSAYLGDTINSMDKQTILQQAQQSLQLYPIDSRSLPEPVWAQKGYTMTGSQVWQEIQKTAHEKHTTSPISIYLHIPFCDRRCAFCDCLSRPLRKNLESAFINKILKEIASWGTLTAISQRPVTTVHFGGGTPDAISWDNFKQIVSALCNTFNITENTELALETNASKLQPAHLKALASSGFSRLHIGIQSFDDAMRVSIGRKGDGNYARLRLTEALKSDFVTTIDLIYGFPQQTLPSFLESIAIAVDTGVHGVSLYRFNISRRNRAFVKRHAFKPDTLSDFAAFLAGDYTLHAAGYVKNHFSHYALPQDRNLYYTYPSRQEDMIALGPTADGELQGLCYRHGDHEYYTENNFENPMGLEGGIFLPDHLRALAPVSGNLVCGSVNRNDFLQAGLISFFESWLGNRLIAPLKNSEIHYLSATGSWFISYLLQELEKKS